MSIKIHKVEKSDLSYITSIDAGMASGFANTTGMTISHYADSPKEVGATIPYSIEIIKETVPYIKEIEFCVAIKKKIDLDAVGPNEKRITKVGIDVGANSNPYAAPHRPPAFPPGFVELYKG